MDADVLQRCCAAVGIGGSRWCALVNARVFVRHCSRAPPGFALNYPALSAGALLLLFFGTMSTIDEELAMGAAGTREGHFPTVQERRGLLNRTRYSPCNLPLCEGGWLRPLQPPFPSALLPPQGSLFALGQPRPTFWRQIDASHRADPLGNICRFENELCGSGPMCVERPSDSSAAAKNRRSTCSSSCD